MRRCCILLLLIGVGCEDEPLPIGVPGGGLTGMWLGDCDHQDSKGPSGQVIQFTVDLVEAEDGSVTGDGAMEELTEPSGFVWDLVVSGQRGDPAVSLTLSFSNDGDPSHYAVDGELVDDDTLRGTCQRFTDDASKVGAAELLRQ